MLAVAGGIALFFAAVWGIGFLIAFIVACYDTR